jgi:salicylate hydroxylase
MAQGAATALEDGAFLGAVFGHVVSGELSITEALELYEKARMPKADYKQQVSFVNGAIWHLPDGPQQEARDAAMSRELQNQPFFRSPNLYGDPQTVLSVYGYDAEDHAEEEVGKYLTKRAEERSKEGITKEINDKFLNWFLEDGAKASATKA